MILRLRSARAADACAILGLVAAAVYYAVAVIWHRAQVGQGVPSFDIYAYFYPNMIYTLRSWSQGHGLFWNRLQNCGQPFFGDSQTALLYPPIAVFWLMNPDTALLVLVVLHLTIGGVGTYLTCREIQLSRAAAVCGALAFEIGGNALGLASWMPIISGAYMWLPFAVYCCERTLRAPTGGSVLLLAGILTLQLLTGYPQISFFTYQLIALRLFWCLATHRSSALRPVALVSAGLLLAPLFAAVHLMPTLEFVRESVRGGSLSVDEIRVMSLTWEGFRKVLGDRQPGYGNTFAALSCAMIGMALVRLRAEHSTTLFYVAIGALYLALPFDNPVFHFYQHLPLGSAFRAPDRFLWVAGFALAMLVALGADVVVSHVVRSGPDPTKRVRYAPLGTFLIGTAGFYFLSPTGLQRWEWGLVAAAFAISGAAVFSDHARAAARVVLPFLIAGNLFGVGLHPFQGNLRDESVFYEHQDAFDFIQERLAPTDRVFSLGQHTDYSLMPKSASVLGFPDVVDYEPQTSQRYAEFFVKMIRGPGSEVRMRSINDFYFFNNHVPRNRALLNLVAARYLIVDSKADPFAEQMRPPLRLLRSADSIHVYENPQALPRALYIPRIVVVDDRNSILDQLSHPVYNPRAIAIVEAEPPDGFKGADPPGTGEVAIVEDRSESLVLHARTTAPGFLFLSDQDYPGWEATVNGVPVPILRANYAFRLIRVPAGDSDVVFRYRPKSLRVGAGVSVGTLLLVGVAFAARRSRWGLRNERLPS